MFFNTYVQYLFFLEIYLKCVKITLVCIGEAIILYCNYKQDEFSAHPLPYIDSRNILLATGEGPVRVVIIFHVVILLTEKIVCCVVLFLWATSDNALTLHFNAVKNVPGGEEVLLETLLNLQQQQQEYLPIEIIPQHPLKKQCPATFLPFKCRTNAAALRVL